MSASVDKQAVQLWLPALNRFDSFHPLHRLLLRADQQNDEAPARMDRLSALFEGAGSPLPAAALLREYLCHDADDDLWLNADPTWIQPDMTGVRLLGIGTLPVEADEAEAFADVLRPIFFDAGMEFELTSPTCWQLHKPAYFVVPEAAPPIQVLDDGQPVVGAPTCWHVRVPANLDVPDFATPEQALGDDLYLHLPAGDQGRRWRVLLNEVQVLLNEHPLNKARERRGQSPINDVWLWGAGQLPASVHTSLAGVASRDDLLLALAQRSGTVAQSIAPETLAATPPGWLVDLQDLPPTDWNDGWWQALESLARQRTLQITFASGERWLSRPWHRWRLWRKAPR